MIKILLLVFLLAAQSNASTDIKKLKDSVFKISVYGQDGAISVATAFSAVLGKDKVLVTNNHVCDAFYKAKRANLISSECLSEIPRTDAKCEVLDTVTEYYMHKGSDICIMKSERSDDYVPLKLSSSKAEPTDSVLISGFVGRSLDLMYVDGKVYGTVSHTQPKDLVSCLLASRNTAANKITCAYFTKYPTYIQKRLQVGVNNIGPGFSGSPVIKNGYIVGIVSMYIRPNPSSGYYNGDVIFYSLEDLSEAIKSHKGNLVKFDSLEYKEFIQITKFDSDISSVLFDLEQQLRQSISEILRDATK